VGKRTSESPARPLAMCPGVVLDHGHTIGTTDPIESKIREDYLRVGQEEQEIL
jgi:hypothetical protein